MNNQLNLPTVSTVIRGLICDEIAEETFDEPVCEEFGFKCKWTLWEHYDNFSQDDYLSSMAKVCWFNDLVSFSVAWNSIPHRELRNIFFDSD